MIEVVCFFFCLFFFVCANYTFLNRTNMLIENSMTRCGLNAISPLGLQSAGHLGFGVVKQSIFNFEHKNNPACILHPHNLQSTVVSS